MAENEDQKGMARALEGINKRLEDIQTNTNLTPVLADAIPRLSDRLNTVAEAIPRLDEKANSLSKQIDNLSKQIDRVGGDTKSYRSTVLGAVVVIVGAIVAGGVYVHQDLRGDNRAVEEELGAVQEKLATVAVAIASQGQSPTISEAKIRGIIREELHQLVLVQGNAKHQNNVFIVSSKEEQNKPRAKPVRDEKGEDSEPFPKRWFNTVRGSFGGIFNAGAEGADEPSSNNPT